MANYETHRNIGVISSVAAGCVAYFSLTYFQNIEMLQFNSLSLFFMVILGVIGSLSPDIDLEYSRPAKFMRFFIYIISALLASAFAIIYHNNIVEFLPLLNNVFYSIGAMVILSFLTVFIGFKLFYMNVVHRGIIHSIPFTILVSILIFETLNFLSLSISLIENLELNNMLIASFFTIGFLVHLILDETYSINIMEMRVKSSFGTALKIIDKNNIIGSIILIGIIISYFIYKMI